MEHETFRSWAMSKGISIDEEQAKDLLAYARMIAETAKKFNITGYKTIREIIGDLVLGSIGPFSGANVPRGTLFIDLGTGAGVPGVPLALFKRNWRGVVVDSNNKKIAFIDRVIGECRIGNLSTRHGRVEELARGEMRDAFDLAVSRAMGNLYLVIETGAPMVKLGGLFYVFSHQGPDEIPGWIAHHASELGLAVIARNRYGEYGLSEIGLLFQKVTHTDSCFPRRMAVIKREIKRLEGRTLQS